MPRFTLEGQPYPIDTDVPSEAAELRAQGWKEETSEELEARTVPELKEELKAQDLPTTGTKPELIARLSGSEAAPAAKGK